MSRLPRLPAGIRIVGPDGAPTQAFSVYWQRLLETQEKIDLGQSDLIEALEETQLALLEAQAAIIEALELAGVAYATAETTVLLQKVRDSYSDDGVLHAADAGDGTATITVDAHNRNYLEEPIEGEGITRALLGGAIAALPYETAYFVFYDDPEFLGGAVTYLATVVEEESVASLENPTRHRVGAITTPAAGGTASEGGSGPPPWKFPDYQLVEP